MDFSFISEFINELGFPMFIAIWLLYMKTKQDKDTIQLLNEIKFLHEEMEHKTISDNNKE